MVFRINEPVTVPLADGSRVRGRVLYLDAAPSDDGKRYADVELLDPGHAAPVVWAAVTELQPLNALGHRCTYSDTRTCDCSTDCSVHFSDDGVGC
jgi:hypothetical protein